MSAGTTLEPVIGLEVHAQLLTESKMFCGCSTSYSDSSPNTHVCAVCSGMPGALPVINRKAVDYTIASALALNCDIASESTFDRKNYQYPDIPKGYQISQYDTPIGRAGWLEYQVGAETVRCGIRRVHLEEDTGKTFHTQADGRDVSLVDYNRSGVPLMEIVSEPELRSPEAAREFFAALRQLLMYLGVCDGKLQEGSMRADVNVSLRGPQGLLGDKVEIKNLNSFRAVERALEYELDRQRQVLAAGGMIAQETRGWSEVDEVTVSQRSKEYAEDYRYFPEPDLPKLVFTPAHLHRVRAGLPETPAAKLSRFQEEYGLSAYTATLLTSERPLADFYEAAVESANGAQPSVVANWITGDVLRLLNEAGRTVESTQVSPQAVGRLVSMVDGGTITGASGKRVLEAMFSSGEDPETIVEREGLKQIADRDAIDRIVDEVLATNQAMVEQYRRGKTNVIQALVGKVMGTTGGRANPQAVRAALDQKLNSGGSS